MNEPKIRKPFDGDFPITQRFAEALPWYVAITGYPHNGIDFGLPEGTPVIATDDGTISYADNVPDSDGKGINIIHNWGISQYWHLSELSAKLGQEVKKGDLIGYSGNTGWSTGPHLHFGIKVKGQGLENMRGWNDPALYFDEAPTQPTAPAIKPVKYTIKKNDTLWGIAEQFYGQGYYWTKIYEANKSVIANPTFIYPGVTINIP